MFYQHGDVIIAEIEAEKVCGEVQPHLILEEGEVTGHMHRVTSGEAQLLVDGGRKFLRARTTVVVSHEEHKPITLPPGQYEITRVKEYDPFEDVVRNVGD